MKPQSQRRLRQTIVVPVVASHTNGHDYQTVCKIVNPVAESELPGMRKRKNLVRTMVVQSRTTGAFLLKYGHGHAQYIVCGNPDFVDIVIHCSRFQVNSGAGGDPSFDAYELARALRPKINLPSITLDGKQDPLKPDGTADHDAIFTGIHERRAFDVGHAFLMEAPGGFAAAILDVHRWARQ